MLFEELKSIDSSCLEGSDSTSAYSSPLTAWKGTILPFAVENEWLKRRKSNHFNIVPGFIFLVSGYVTTGFLVVSETKILKIKMKNGSNSDKNLVGFWSTWGGGFTAGILSNFYSKISCLFVINQISLNYFFRNIH